MALSHFAVAARLLKHMKQRKLCQVVTSTISPPVSSQSFKCITAEIFVVVRLKTGQVASVCNSANVYAGVEGMQVNSVQLNSNEYLTYMYNTACKTYIAWIRASTVTTPEHRTDNVGFFNFSSSEPNNSLNYHTQFCISLTAGERSNTHDHLLERNNLLSESASSPDFCVS